MPSKNPSKKALPLKNLLRTLLRSVRLHDPLGVRPSQTQPTRLDGIMCAWASDFPKDCGWGLEEGSWGISVLNLDFCLRSMSQTRGAPLSILQPQDSSVTALLWSENYLGNHLADTGSHLC